MFPTTKHSTLAVQEALEESGVDSQSNLQICYNVLSIHHGCVQELNVFKSFVILAFAYLF